MKDGPTEAVSPEKPKNDTGTTGEQTLEDIDKEISRVDRDIQKVRDEIAANTAGLYLFEPTANAVMHPVPCPCIGPILARNQKIADRAAKEYAHLFQYGKTKPFVYEEDVKKEGGSDARRDVESEQAFVRAKDPATLLQPVQVNMPTDEVVRANPEHFEEIAKILGARHCHMTRKGLRVSQDYLEEMNVWRRKTLIHYAQELAKMLPGGVAQAIAHVQAQAHQQKKVFKTRSGKVVGLNDPAAALARCRTVLERMVAEAATNGVTVAFFQAQAAKIPGMLPPDAPERKFAFNDKSLLVEDPVAQDEQFRKRVIWTPEDVEIFKKKFAQHSKNFSKIAAHLPGKTVEDCVQFFYINKHKLQLKKQVPTEPPTPGKGGSHKRPRAEHDEQHNGDNSPTVTPPIDGEKGATAPPAKKPEPGTSTPRKGEWQKEEKQRFFEGLKLYGQDFSQIAKHVGTRSSHQCSNFYLTYKRRQHRVDTSKEEHNGIKSPASPTVVKTEGGAIILPSAPEYVGTSNQQQKTHMDDDHVQRDIFESLGMDVLTADEEVIVMNKLAEYGKSWKQIAEALPSITQAHLRTWYKANNERLQLSKIAIIGKRKKRSIAQQQQQVLASCAAPSPSPSASPVFFVQTPSFTTAQPAQIPHASNLSILCDAAAVATAQVQQPAPQPATFTVTPTVAIPAPDSSASVAAAATTLEALSSVALPPVLPTTSTAAATTTAPSVPLIVPQTAAPQQQQQQQQQSQPQPQPQPQQPEQQLSSNPLLSLQCLAQLAISEADDNDDSQPAMETK